jgi:hypothetical protein
VKEKEREKEKEKKKKRKKKREREKKRDSAVDVSRRGRDHCICPKCTQMQNTIEVTERKLEETTDEVT